MDKSGAGAGFLRELRFSLPIYIPSTSAQSSSVSPKAGKIGQEWPQCQKPHKPNKKKPSELWRGRGYPWFSLAGAVAKRKKERKDDWMIMMINSQL
jgi:hypothetical protein